MPSSPSSVTGLVMLVTWWLLCVGGAFPAGTVPHPWDVAVAFGDEIESGRLLADTIASLVSRGLGLHHGHVRSRSRSASWSVGPRTRGPR